MSTVFPMRTVFGSTQQKESDCSIINDYKVITKEGTELKWTAIMEQDIPTEPQDKIQYITNYVYKDSDNSGKIIISEVYTTPNGLLDHVIIQKTNVDPRTTHQYKTIAMTLYHPAISTELHSLLQLAGVIFEGTYEHTLNYFHSNEDNKKTIIIKNQLGIQYQSE
jgi:hypothetical protein